MEQCCRSCAALGGALSLRAAAPPNKALNVRESIRRPLPFLPIWLQKTPNDHRAGSSRVGFGAPRDSRLTARNCISTRSRACEPLTNLRLCLFLTVPSRHVPPARVLVPRRPRRAAYLHSTCAPTRCSRCPRRFCAPCTRRQRARRLSLAGAGGREGEAGRGEEGLRLSGCREPQWQAYLTCNCAASQCSHRLKPDVPVSAVPRVLPAAPSSSNGKVLTCPCRSILT